MIIAVSMYSLTNVYADLGFWFMARSRMLFGVGFPLIFVSITSASYDGIPPDKTGQASALINAARNTGGSIGISLISNVLWRREQFHQNMLVDQALPSSVQYDCRLGEHRWNCSGPVWLRRQSWATSFSIRTKPDPGLQVDLQG